MGKLREILPKEFKEGLTPAEGILLDAAERGEPAVFGDIEKDDPKDADKWGPERTIRASLLRWLCVDPKAAECVDPAGVYVCSARIVGKIYFSSCTLTRPVEFKGCLIETLLLIDARTKFLSLDKSILGSITADRLKVEGNVHLRGINTNGEVSFRGAEIGGLLDCDEAVFVNPKDEKSFSADELKVKGSVFFRKVNAKGAVRFLGADIGGQLSCKEAVFENAKGDAFSADRLKVKGDVLFDKVNAKGKVLFSGADIGGQLSCDGAVFENAKGDAFSAQQLVVKNILFFELKSSTGSIDLTGASVAHMHADFSSLSKWPDKGSLHLAGFEYDDISSKNSDGERVNLTAKQGIAWLRLQPSKPFHTQPYEQLAKVFRTTGREHDAREVLIAKYDDMRNHVKLHWGTRFWYWLIGWSVGYGYKPGKALLALLGFFIAGSIVFSLANNFQYMHPTKLNTLKTTSTLEPEFSHLPSSFYPEFVAPAYSLDTLIPFVDLHQEEYWITSTCQGYGEDRKCESGECWGYQIYLWFHICAGWFFSTLALLSFTGLLKKD